MKSNFNYLLLLALATTIATYTHEDDFASCEVFLESPDYRLDTYFRALFLKPTANNLHYAAQATPLPIQSPSWNIYNLHPDYHFGFDLGTRVILHNRKTNLALNWEHFHSRTCAAHTVPVNTDMVGPFFEIGPDASLYQKAAGRVNFKFNNVNLTYGQYVNFGDCLQTNLFAGIDFTQIKQRSTAIYSNTDGSILRSINTPSSFIGAGPKIGCDFAYDITKGLNLTGHVTTALLIGHIRNFTSYSSQSPALTAADFQSPNLQYTCTQKSTQVVPEFAERLGLAYFFSFCESYMIKLEVGYEARIYINALQSVNIGSEVVTPPVLTDTAGVFARTFQTTLSNFALTGPYIAFNVAF